MSDDLRTQHPFHMHDAILAQPEAFARTVERNAEAADRLAAEAASGGRLFFVGIGTSFHAARVGEHLAREYGGGVDARAVHSFDFALYGPELAPEDLVVGISHRGNKRYTVEGLGRAREAGCLTALVAGEGGGGGAVGADHVLFTVGQERSAAHTVSYTGAVAALASLAVAFGERGTGTAPLAENLLTEGLPDALREALGTEEEAAALAREHAGRRRIWLAGGGPSAVTAEEVALKIKETSYLQAEGTATEALIHGPLLCAEAEDLFVLVAPDGAARERTLELSGLVEELGAPALIVGDGVPEVPEGARWIAVPPVPEPFSALTCLVPLQLFAYHLALARGKNPDSFRADDPLFPKIRERVRL